MDLFLDLVQLLLQVLTFAILARAILSWFPIRPYHPLVQFLHSITEPILAPLRRIIPRVGMLDITPLIAILILQALSALLS